MPETFGVEGGDLMVLTTVVCENFAATLLVLGKSLGPSPDVERVLGVSQSDIIKTVSGWIPVRVAIDDIAKPFLSTCQQAGNPRANG